MTAQQSTAAPVRWWVPGDWNAFFGLFTNVVLNVIVLTGLCLGVVKLPEGIVFGRILPALGIALPIGNLYYAYLAYRLAKAERRSDVAAMPYGPSVPHMFIVVFVVMLPVYLKTNNALLAWEAGLAWAFIIGVIVLIGAFVGPTIRKFTPRAAMLGTLAGISIAFISMRPAFQMWEIPWIAFVSLAIVLVSWTANVRLPFGIPGGLAAVIVGTVIGWVVVALGWSDVLKSAEVSASLAQFGLHLPWPSGEVFRGLSEAAPLLVTAIPLGIYNFTEGMNNVESASAAGDSYNLRHILLADGIGAVVGSLLGSPFPPAVYIGHPGWKAVGGRIGYSLATGIVIALVCFLGLTAFLLAVVPLVAILPILLYIGLVIGAQAFQASPAKHAPAVVLAIIPNIAAWGQLQVDGALNAAGTSAAKVGIGKMAGSGVIYHGMELLGGGAVLAGLVLGAIAAFIIDREFNKATIYAFAGAVLSYFGFIHGLQLQFGASPEVALGYLLLGLICYGLGMREAKTT
ncbi:MAG TPA: regulator [Alphaproteobacteria bacterium]|nr:regulator [Alphaproteobacteria bacterium]